MYEALYAALLARKTKVSWLLLDSWQNLTHPIHHIFIQFYVPFGKKKRKNMDRSGFELIIKQSRANSLNHWTTKLLEKYLTPKSEILKKKRNQNWKKMWGIGAVEPIRSTSLILCSHLKTRQQQKSAHPTSNSRNPEFQFPQFKVL